MYKIPPGGRGVYSQLKAYMGHAQLSYDATCIRVLCFQRCIVMRLFYFSYKQVKHDFSLLRAYAIICGRFNITVNWDYLHAQNQGKLASVCLHRFSSIFESTIMITPHASSRSRLQNLLKGVKPHEKTLMYSHFVIKYRSQIISISIWFMLMCYAPVNNLQ